MANTRAITRGVSWPAASCTTINTDDSTNTRNVGIDPASAPSTARTPSEVWPNTRHPVAASSARTTGAATSAAARAVTAHGTSEVRATRRNR